jgi:hypothetical protein
LRSQHKKHTKINKAKQNIHEREQEGNIQLNGTTDLSYQSWVLCLASMAKPENLLLNMQHAKENSSALKKVTDSASIRNSP